MQNGYVNIEIEANSGLELLTNDEIALISEHTHGETYQLLKQCVLAVLNSNVQSDEFSLIQEQMERFDLEILQLNKGLKLKLIQVPESALVDGEMIQGLKEMIFSVLRDIIFLKQEIETNTRLDLNSSSGCSNAIFHILRNAKALITGAEPNLTVCWGGHAISDLEYKYSKEVGYRLGLRKLDIITGCGIGAMKGPMKGALISHSKQRICSGRYIGISEPGIIASESPNPVVNELIIMPDIEKRLEAFVRLGHGIIVFPGGVGTAEEILYILGILLHPKNKQLPFPLIFSGPKESADYFKQIDQFIGATLGAEAQSKYQIIIDDPIKVAQTIKQGIEQVREYRKSSRDAYHYNWKLFIDWDFQEAFIPTHENMANLNLNLEQEEHQLASNLRKAFSGLVAGNVKQQGIEQIKQHGPYLLTGDSQLMQKLDDLLKAFVEQKRMKLDAEKYEPCYKLQ